MSRPYEPEASMARNSADESAAEWVLKLRDSSVTLQDILDWQKWMHEDERHAAAFHRMEELEEILKHVPRPAIREERSSRRYWTALAASIFGAALLIGTALLYESVDSSARSPNLAFATRVGENRSVHLQDGSTVILGGDSSMEVRFTRRERRIRLTRGEAFFTAVHDPDWPLEVTAGGAVVVDVGTEFDVRYGANRVVVNVVEGRVRVEPRVALVPLPLLAALEPRLAPVAVSAGEETTVQRGGISRAVHSADAADSTSWISGRLAFRMEPLAEVLEAVNRYSKKRIVTADPAIANLRVTGTVDVKNLSAWIASLGRALGIGAHESGNRILLTREPDSH